MNSAICSTAQSKPGVEAVKIGPVELNPGGALCMDGIPSAQTSSAGGEQPARETQTVGKFNFDGNKWTLEYEGLAVIEKDRLGLYYIYQLIQRTGKELHVTDLVTKAYGEAVDIMKEEDLLEGDVAVEDEAEDSGDNPRGRVVSTEFRDEILPDEDRAKVLDWLEKCKEQLAVLKAKGSLNPIHEKEWEIETIQEYLSQTRFGSKNACFDSRADKDRKSVSKAIKDAIRKIGKNHPSLADHLNGAIQTGGHCIYRPKLEMHWEVATRGIWVAPTNYREQ